MKRHQYGISELVSQTSFRGETSGGIAECRLFSQANFLSFWLPFTRLAISTPYAALFGNPSCERRTRLDSLPSWQSAPEE